MLSDLAFGLAEKGENFHVITSRGLYEGPDGSLPSRESVGNVQIHRVWSTRFGRQNLVGRTLDYLSFYFSVCARLLVLMGPKDVVVAKTDPPLLAAVILPLIRLRGAHLVNWLQDIFPEIAIRADVISEYSRVAVLAHYLRNWSLRKAVTNVVICEGMRQLLMRQNINPKSLKVIPNWSDADIVYPVSAAENPLVQEWGLAEKFVIGYSGNLGRVHEIETIEKAVMQLDDDLELLFLFIGGGVGYDKLQARTQKLQTKNVRFIPYQPRDLLHLSLSVPDLHLVSLTPNMEGLVFPSKVYGILAAGRPIVFIGAQNSEISQMLIAENCGISTESSNSEELVSAIQRLRRDEKTRQAMGRCARELFERKYDKALAIEKWQDLLADTAQSYTS